MLGEWRGALVSVCESDVDEASETGSVWCRCDCGRLAQRGDREYLLGESPRAESVVTTATGGGFGPRPGGEGVAGRPGLTNVMEEPPETGARADMAPLTLFKSR